MEYITDYVYKLCPYIYDKMYELALNTDKKLADYSYAGDIEQYLVSKTDDLGAKWDKDKFSTLMIAMLPADCFIKNITFHAKEPTNSLKCDLNLYAVFNEDEIYDEELYLHIANRKFIKIATLAPKMNMEYTEANWSKSFDFDGGPNNTLKQFILKYIKSEEEDSEDYQYLEILKRHANDGEFCLGFEVETASTDGTGNDNLITEISFVKSSISTNTVKTPLLEV